MYYKRKVVFFFITITFMLLFLDVLAWWDSTYYYRYPILEDTTTCMVKSINDTYGINRNIIWTYTCDDSYVYSTESGPLGTITIANETDEKYWEDETSGTGNSITNVWGINSSLVLHFDSDASDSSPNGFTGVLSSNSSSTPNYISGKFGNAVDFDTNDYQGYIFPSLGLHNPPYWSVELWFYRKGNSNDFRKEGEMFRTYTDTRAGFQISDNWIKHKKFSYHDYDGNCLYWKGNEALTADSFPDNAWNYGVVVCNSTHILLYLNGTLKNTTFCNCSSFNSFPSTGASVGIDLRNNESYAWNGSIDEVRVWNKALSTDEIFHNWNNGINNLTTLGIEQTLIVNKATPSASLVIDPAGWTHIYPTATNVSCFASPLNNEVTCLLWRDGVSKTNQEEILSGVGSYVYKTNTSETANYSANNTGESQTLTINKGALTGTLSVSDVTYPTSLSASTTETNIGDSDVEYEIYCNSTLMAESTGSTPSGSKQLKAGVYNCVFNTSSSTFVNWTANSSIDSTTATINKGSTSTNLLFDGYDGDKSYLRLQTVNFTAAVNISDKNVKLDSNYTGWTLQSDTTPLYNQTNITVVGTHNFTGYFEEDENYTASSETHYLTVTLNKTFYPKTLIRSIVDTQEDWYVLIGLDVPGTVNYTQLPTGYFRLKVVDNTSQSVNFTNGTTWVSFYASSGVVDYTIYYSTDSGFVREVDVECPNEDYSDYGLWCRWVAIPGDGNYNWYYVRSYINVTNSTYPYTAPIIYYQNKTQRFTPEWDSRSATYWTFNGSNNDTTFADVDTRINLTVGTNYNNSKSLTYGIWTVDVNYSVPRPQDTGDDVDAGNPGGGGTITTSTTTTSTTIKGTTTTPTSTTIPKTTTTVTVEEGVGIPTGEAVMPTGRFVLTTRNIGIITLTSVIILVILIVKVKTSNPMRLQRVVFIYII